jgi:hypothetical protein
MPALSDFVPRPPKVSTKETRANAAHLYKDEVFWKRALMDADYNGKKSFVSRQIMVK